MTSVQRDPASIVLEQLRASGRAAALEELDRSAADDDDLCDAIGRHLRASPGGSVYTTPDGFRAFIDNCSNVALYDDVIRRLRGVHGDLCPSSVVDLGAGDGRVTSAVVRDDIGTIDIVEPAADLLRSAIENQSWPVRPTPHQATMHEWVASLPPGRVYDLIQSTFALHTIAPDQRHDLLLSMQSHVRHVAIVDFDVPRFEDGSRAHADYVAGRYRRAIAEYREFPLAIDGFLIPVMLGQFDPAIERATFEQSGDRWVEQFRAAGYTVAIEPIHDYWWAGAFVLLATSPSS